MRAQASCRHGERPRDGVRRGLRAMVARPVAGIDRPDGGAAPGAGPGTRPRRRASQGRSRGGGRGVYCAVARPIGSIAAAGSGTRAVARGVLPSVPVSTDPGRLAGPRGRRRAAGRLRDPAPSPSAVAAAAPARPSPASPGRPGGDARRHPAGDRARSPVGPGHALVADAGRVARLEATRCGVGQRRDDDRVPAAQPHGHAPADMAARLRVEPPVELGWGLVDGRTATSGRRPRSGRTLYHFALLGATAPRGGLGRPDRGAAPPRRAPSRATADRDPADTGIEVTFDQPGIRPADVRDHVRSRPPIAGRFETAAGPSRSCPRGRSRAGTLYTVTVTRGLPVPETGRASSRRASSDSRRPGRSAPPSAPRSRRRSRSCSTPRPLSAPSSESPVAGEPTT